MSIENIIFRKNNKVYLDEKFYKRLIKEIARVKLGQIKLIESPILRLLTEDDEPVPIEGTQEYDDYQFKKNKNAIEDLKIVPGSYDKVTLQVLDEKLKELGADDKSIGAINLILDKASGGYAEGLTLFKNLYSSLLPGIQEFSEYITANLTDKEWDLGIKFGASSRDVIWICTLIMAFIAQDRTKDQFFVKMLCLIWADDYTTWGEFFTSLGVEILIQLLAAIVTGGASLYFTGIGTISKETLEEALQKAGKELGEDLLQAAGQKNIAKKIGKDMISRGAVESAEELSEKTLNDQIKTIRKILEKVKNGQYLEAAEEKLWKEISEEALNVTNVDKVLKELEASLAKAGTKKIRNKIEREIRDELVEIIGSDVTDGGVWNTFKSFFKFGKKINIYDLVDSDKIDDIIKNTLNSVIDKMKEKASAEALSDSTKSQIKSKLKNALVKEVKDSLQTKLSAQGITAAEEKAYRALSDKIINNILTDDMLDNVTKRLIYEASETGIFKRLLSQSTAGFVKKDGIKKAFLDKIIIPVSDFYKKLKLDWGTLSRMAKLSARPAEDVVNAAKEALVKKMRLQKAANGNLHHLIIKELVSDEVYTIVSNNMDKVTKFGNILKDKLGKLTPKELENFDIDDIIKTALKDAGFNDEVLNGVNLQKLGSLSDEIVHGPGNSNFFEKFNAKITNLAGSHIDSAYESFGPVEYWKALVGDSVPDSLKSMIKKNMTEDQTKLIGELIEKGIITEGTYLNSVYKAYKELLATAADESFIKKALKTAGMSLFAAPWYPLVYKGGDPSKALIVLSGIHWITGTGGKLPREIQNKLIKSIGLDENTRAFTEDEKDILANMIEFGTYAYSKGMADAYLDKLIGSDVNLDDTGKLDASNKQTNIDNIIDEFEGNQAQNINDILELTNSFSEDPANTNTPAFEYLNFLYVASKESRERALSNKFAMEEVGKSLKDQSIDTVNAYMLKDKTPYAGRGKPLPENLPLTDDEVDKYLAYLSRIGYGWNNQNTMTKQHVKDTYGIDIAGNNYGPGEEIHPALLAQSRNYQKRLKDFKDKEKYFDRSTPTFDPSIITLKRKRLIPRPANWFGEKVMAGIAEVNEIFKGIDHITNNIFNILDAIDRVNIAAGDFNPLPTAFERQFENLKNKKTLQELPDKIESIQFSKGSSWIKQVDLNAINPQRWFKDINGHTLLNQITRDTANALRNAINNDGYFKKDEVVQNYVLMPQRNVSLLTTEPDWQRFINTAIQKWNNINQKFSKIDWDNLNNDYAAVLNDMYRTDSRNAYLAKESSARNKKTILSESDLRKIISKTIQKKNIISEGVDATVKDEYGLTDLNYFFRNILREPNGNIKERKFQHVPLDELYDNMEIKLLKESDDAHVMGVQNYPGVFHTVKNGSTDNSEKFEIYIAYRKFDNSTLKLGNYTDENLETIDYLFKIETYNSDSKKSLDEIYSQLQAAMGFYRKKREKSMDPDAKTYIEESNFSFKEEIDILKNNIIENIKSSDFNDKSLYYIPVVLIGTRGNSNNIFKATDLNNISTSNDKQSFPTQSDNAIYAANNSPKVSIKDVFASIALYQDEEILKALVEKQKEHNVSLDENSVNRNIRIEKSRVSAKKKKEESKDEKDGKKILDVDQMRNHYLNHMNILDERGQWVSNRADVRGIGSGSYLSNYSAQYYFVICIEKLISLQHLQKSEALEWSLYKYGWDISYQKRAFNGKVKDDSDGQINGNHDPQSLQRLGFVLGLKKILKIAKDNSIGPFKDDKIKRIDLNIDQTDTNLFIESLQEKIKEKDNSYSGYYSYPMSGIGSFLRDITYDIAPSDKDSFSKKVFTNENKKLKVNQKILNEIFRMYCK